MASAPWSWLTPLGDIGLQARAHLSLGRVYYDMGNYARAVESLERNVVTLQGDLLYERFGSNNIVAAASRAWLSSWGVDSVQHGGPRHGRGGAPDRRDR